MTDRRFAGVVTVVDREWTADDDACWQFDHGTSCNQEVWCGNERVLDTDAVIERC